jgi:N-acetylglucosaminyl-diphospho-decaprenol L-rhamnosyltransferase
VIELRQNLGAVARTIGAERATTPLVAFSDDDSWWAPGALLRGARHFAAHPRLVLLAARIIVAPGGIEDPTCGLMAASPLERHPDLPGPTVLGFVACGAIVRREAFLAVGGFDPRLVFVAEERMLAIELAARGLGLAYAPDVVAYHHPSPAREPGRHRRLEARNRLWIAWLRRPLDGALRETASALLSVRDRDTLAGIAAAARGVPWVVRARDPVSRELERDLRRLR